MPVPESYSRRLGGSVRQETYSFSTTRSSNSRPSYLSNYTSKYSSTLPPRPPLYERKISELNTSSTTGSRFLNGTSSTTRSGTTYGSSYNRSSVSPVRGATSSLRRNLEGTTGTSTTTSITDRLRALELSAEKDASSSTSASGYKYQTRNKDRDSVSSVGSAKSAYGSYSRDRSGSRELGSSPLSTSSITLASRERERERERDLKYGSPSSTASEIIRSRSTSNAAGTGTTTTTTIGGSAGATTTSSLGRRSNGVGLTSSSSSLTGTEVNKSSVVSSGSESTSHSATPTNNSVVSKMNEGGDLLQKNDCSSSRDVENNDDGSSSTSSNSPHNVPSRSSSSSPPPPTQSNSSNNSAISSSGAGEVGLTIKNMNGNDTNNAKITSKITRDLSSGSTVTRKSIKSDLQNHHFKDIIIEPLQTVKTATKSATATVDTNGNPILNSVDDTHDFNNEENNSLSSSATTTTITSKAKLLLTNNDETTDDNTNSAGKKRSLLLSRSPSGSNNITAKLATNNDDSNSLQTVRSSSTVNLKTKSIKSQNQSPSSDSNANVVVVTNNITPKTSSTTTITSKKSSPSPSSLSPSSSSSTFNKVGNNNNNNGSLTSGSGPDMCVGLTTTGDNKKTAEIIGVKKSLLKPNTLSSSKVQTKSKVIIHKFSLEDQKQSPSTSSSEESITKVSLVKPKSSTLSSVEKNKTEDDNEVTTTFTATLRKSSASGPSSTSLDNNNVISASSTCSKEEGETATTTATIGLGRKTSIGSASSEKRHSNGMISTVKLPSSTTTSTPSSLTSTSSTILNSSSPASWINNNNNNNNNNVDEPSSQILTKHNHTLNYSAYNDDTKEEKIQDDVNLEVKRVNHKYGINSKNNSSSNLVSTSSTLGDSPDSSIGDTQQQQQVEQRKVQSVLPSKRESTSPFKDAQVKIAKSYTSSRSPSPATSTTTATANNNSSTTSSNSIYNSNSNNSNNTNSNVNSNTSSSPRNVVKAPTPPPLPQLYNHRQSSPTSSSSSSPPPSSNSLLKREQKNVTEKMAGPHSSKYASPHQGKTETRTEERGRTHAYANTSDSSASDNESEGYSPSPQIGRFRTRESEKAGLTGLRNIGNTCFMNSVLQCLSNTKPLLEYILQESYEINTTTSGMKGALMRAFSQVIQELWRETRTVDTSAFKDQIQRFAPRFMGYSQQDAQEFLRYLLEGLHEDVNRVTAKPKPITTDIDDNLSDSQKAAESWKRYLRYDDSKIVDIFVGQLKSTLKCTTCGHCSVTFDPFWDLSLPIPSRLNQTKLSNCFELFTREEVLDGDEKPTCSKCQCRRKCTKSLSIQKFPKILVVHLKRFSPTERYRGKLSTCVEYPLKGLDLSAFAANSSSLGIDSTYNLYGLSNHSGSTYSGHYVAYCAHPYTGDWHCYNDSRVSPVSTNSLVSSEGYVLFYERNSQSSHL